MRSFLPSLVLISSLAAAAGEPTTAPQEAAHVRGEHPAIVARRVLEQQSYDYAAKVYPHPAWLYLSADAPHPMSDHPAVIVFQRAQEEENRLAVGAADRDAMEH